MGDVLVKPAFVSLIPDTGDTTKLGPNAWNAARLFSGGTDGQIVVASAASATGAAWATPSSGVPTGVAAGSVLVSNGVGAAPVFSATPSLDSVLFRGVAGYPLIVAPLDSDSPAFRFGVQRFAGINSPDPRADIVATFGWNLQAGGGRFSPADVAMGLAFENYYVAGGVPSSEFHITTTDLSGVEHRVFSSLMPRDGGVGSSLSVASDVVVFRTYAGTTKLQFNLLGNNIALTGIGLDIGPNNFQWAKQINSAGNALLSLPYVNASDQLVVPGAAYFPGTVQFNGLLSGASFGSDVNFNAASAIFGSAQGVRLSSVRLDAASSVLFSWTSTTHAYDTRDTGIGRNAAGVVEINTGTAGALRDLLARNHLAVGYYEGTEMTAPAAGAVNTGRLFFQDNGAGKTQLMVRFATGAAQQVAIEP